MPSLARPQNPASTLPPPAQAPVPVAGQIPVERLQATLSDLSQQLVGLRAQQGVLRQQLRRMPSNDARAGLEAQKALLDNQVVQLQMQVEAAKAQIGSKFGVSATDIGPTGTIVVPDRFPHNGVDPNMVVGLSFTFAICVGLPIAIAYARRIWRGKSKDVVAKPDESAQRLERLEHAVDAIAIEIERVAEGQRFVTKIFAARPAAARASEFSPKVDAQDAALGDVKPFLALGAGPIEQIRVAEWQAVKQSITPH